MQASFFAPRQILEILPAENGWVIRSSSYRNDQVMQSGFLVARTPDELAEILKAWASQEKPELTTGPIA